MPSFPKPAWNERRKQKQRERRAAERAARKAVWAHYGRRCNVPGCTVTVSLHLHHIVPRSLSKALQRVWWNLVPICAGHHADIHAKRLRVIPAVPMWPSESPGDAARPRLTWEWADGPSWPFC